VFGTLDRYLGRSILSTSLLVLLTLVALAGVFAFIAELEDIGKGQYTPIIAAQYILLTLPGVAYLFFAPAVLLGSLLGLGALATNSELTVMRAAGVSVGRIVRSVLITGVALTLVVAVLGETVMPRTEQIAEELRLKALEERLSSKGSSGLWVRSGKRYVNIATVMPDLTLLGVTVHTFREQTLVESLLAARAVRSDNDDWVLEDIKVSSFEEDGVVTTEQSSALWSEISSNSGVGDSAATLISPELVKSLSVSSESLSARNLYEQMRYLRDNQLDSKRTELSFWQKITSPLSTLVMLMLSLPFVFGSQRSGGAGQRIFVGILLGIVYVLVNKLLTQVALNTGFTPLISAILPLFLFSIKGWHSNYLILKTIFDRESVS